MVRTNADRRATRRKSYWANRPTELAASRKYHVENKPAIQLRKRKKYAENAESERDKAKARRESWTPERRAHERRMNRDRYHATKKVAVELIEVSEE